MDNTVWADLIAAATDRAHCAQADCHVNWLPTPWYADYEHLVPHDCPACEPDEYPRYLVSVHTLMTMSREKLVARLALWLSHHHGIGPLSREASAQALDVPPTLTTERASDGVTRDCEQARGRE